MTLFIILGLSALWLLVGVLFVLGHPGSAFGLSFGLLYVMAYVAMHGV